MITETHDEKGNRALLVIALKMIKYSFHIYRIVSNIFHK